MAVTSVKEQTHLRKSQRSKDGTRSATRVYVVRTDAATDPVELETATDGTNSIPAIASGHPSDSSRRVTSVSAEPKGDSLTAYTVTVEYETFQGGESEDAAIQPWDEPDEIEWGGSDNTESVFRDVDGFPVVNSAGEPFEDFLERECSELTITVTRKSLNFDAATAIAYRHKLNSDSFVVDGVTIAVGQAKMGTISARTNYYEGQKYYVIQFPMKVKEDWTKYIEDRGYNELSGSTLKAITKSDPPTPVDKPYPLNGSGAKQASPTTAPAQLDFYLYDSAPFAVFNFS